MTEERKLLRELKGCNDKLIKALSDDPSCMAAILVATAKGNNDRITALLSAPAPEPVADWCKWSPEDAVEMPDTWRGDCGILWTFTEGGPHENGVKFCHNCGKQVALPLPALPECAK